MLTADDRPRLRTVKAVLRPYQSQTVMTVMAGVHRRRGATFTVMFPRQAGKNEVSAAFVAGLLRMHSKEGGSVVVCAPTLTPQAAISLERTLRWLRWYDHLSPDGTHYRVDGNVLRAGLASAVFLSASPTAHVAGHTASIALVADEAQDIDPDWFDRQFRPMAASTGAATVLFGTPWDGRSLLERAVARNLAIETRRGDGLKLHHQVSWREVARYVPPYGPYVRSERARLGAKHPLFTSQYELAAGEAAGRLFSPAHLQAMEGSHPRLAGPLPGERYAAGLDFGGDRPGADETVLTIARAGERRCEVVQLCAWRGISFAGIEEELLALCRTWRLERLAVDGTGMGAVLAANLEAAFGERVERFIFTANSKPALAFAMLAAAERGRLHLFADDGSPEARAARAQLARCEARRQPGGQLAWGSSRGDDYVASLALCLRACEQVAPPRVATGRLRG